MWSEYPWGTHGEDGVDLVRQFLVQRNFWPRESCLWHPSSQLPQLARTTEHNMLLLQQSIPRANQQGVVASVVCNSGWTMTCARTV